MTVEEQNAVNALTRRVDHAACIASMVAENHDDHATQTAFEGIAELLHETVGKLYQMTDTARLSAR